LSVNIPNGQTLNVDVSGMTQLASDFGISNNNINGNAPATFQSVSVSTNGIVNEVYSNGAQVPVFKIPLATVASVNSLTPVAGDAYQANSQSGSLVVGAANEGGFGSINGNELESSTVDLATELTNMVVAQNSYSANSKVFQVGSELLEELSNLVK
jgi:flagellar hook protein FlgE